MKFSKNFEFFLAKKRKFGDFLLQFSSFPFIGGFFKYSGRLIPIFRGLLKVSEVRNFTFFTAVKKKNLLGFLLTVWNYGVFANEKGVIWKFGFWKIMGFFQMKFQNYGVFPKKSQNYGVFLNEISNYGVFPNEISKLWGFSK